MLKKLIAVFVVVAFVGLFATVKPDGTIGTVSTASAQSTSSSSAPDKSLAIILSILVPGILQILWTDEASTGIVYLLVAILGNIAIGIVLGFVFSGFLFNLAWLIAALFYFGVGYFAWLKAAPKMYGTAGGGGGSGGSPANPSLEDASLPIALEPVFLYNGNPVPAY